MLLVTGRPPAMPVALARRGSGARKAGRRGVEVAGPSGHPVLQVKAV